MTCSDLTKRTHRHWNEAGVTQHWPMNPWILWSYMSEYMTSIFKSDPWRSKPLCWIGCDAEMTWKCRVRPPITGIFALDRPRRVPVVPSHGGARRRRSVWHRRRLPFGLHGGVQRRLAVVWERRQPVVWQAVPQRVGELEPAEPVGHSVPPGLEKSGAGKNDGIICQLVCEPCSRDIPSPWDLPSRPAALGRCWGTADSWSGSGRLCRAALTCRSPPACTRIPADAPAQCLTRAGRGERVRDWSGESDNQINENTRSSSRSRVLIPVSSILIDEGIQINQCKKKKKWTGLSLERSSLCSSLVRSGEGVSKRNHRVSLFLLKIIKMKIVPGSLRSITKSKAVYPFFARRLTSAPWLSRYLTMSIFLEWKIKIPFVRWAHNFCFQRIINCPNSRFKTLRLSPSSAYFTSILQFKDTAKCALLADFKRVM